MVEINGTMVIVKNITTIQVKILDSSSMITIFDVNAFFCGNVVYAYDNCFLSINGIDIPYRGDKDATAKLKEDYDRLINLIKLNLLTE